MYNLSFRESSEIKGKKMVKKTVKKQTNITIEIEKDVAEALGINKKTDLAMVVVDDMLIVKAKKSSSKKKGRTKDISRLMDQYEPLLKKLAKT